MAKADLHPNTLVFMEAIGAPLTETPPVVRTSLSEDGPVVYIAFHGENARNLTTLFQWWADANHVLLFQVAPFEFKVLSLMTADHVLGVPYFTEVSA
jgi:hypothetical protein